MHRLRLGVAVVALLLFCFGPQFAGSQEPAPATPTSPATQSQDSQTPQPAPSKPASTASQQNSQSSSSSKDSSSKGKKYSHANDFLIRGTVFQPNALAFPAVQLRIRRATDKKFRWETYTNSRGEFAVRVPQGLQYELLVHAKGFTDQMRTIDATSGISEDNVAFRMEPIAGSKTGGKQ
jgi:Carboxypeptidase regulatory-like domain